MSAALPLARRERLEAMEGVHFWSVGRDRLCLELVERFTMAGPMVDAGAGSGAFARRLRSAGHRAYGFDLADSAAADLRATILSMPLRAESVGTVIARDVLEHIEDDAAALRDCHWVLGQSGHLLLTVPAWPSLWSVRDEEAGHQRRYTRARLSAVIEGAGFDLLEMRGYQFLLLPALAASRAAARLLGDRVLEREERVSGPLCQILSAINSMEARLGRSRWTCPPTGSSLCAVARKH